MHVLLSDLPARLDAVFLGAIAERELGELPLEIHVTPDGAVLGDDQELLIVGPAQSANLGDLVPANAPNELASGAVNLNAGLGDLSCPVGRDLGLVAAERCAASRRLVSCCRESPLSALAPAPDLPAPHPTLLRLVPMAPEYGAPATA